MNLSKGDKVVATVSLPGIPVLSLEWTVTRENKSSYRVFAQLGNGHFLHLYLNKATGKITR